MSCLHAVQPPTTLELLVAFSDLTAFARTVNEKVGHDELFQLMNDYAELVGDIIEPAGGRVVKFIGDAALIVFPADRVDDGATALLALKEQGDAWWAAQGLPCQHIIKAHFGPVACGPMGTRSEKRFDVFGDSVNTAARLTSRGVALTPQVFRKLSADTRKLFKKHTPPTTYIPVADPHRD